MTVLVLSVATLAQIRDDDSSVWLARFAARFLYGISPIDPVSIVVTVALLGAASLLPTYLPARRAAKIDPMMALRCE